MKRRLVPRRTIVICGVACALLHSGCALGRKWFQMDSNSGMPSMGVELRAGNEAPGENSRIQEPASDNRSIRPARLAEEKPRSLIPDWLKLGGRHEPIPLPTTASAEVDASGTTPTGPREDFD
jgi:hypothetical protein